MRKTIAAELALVSLSELEGRIESDPELLVSSEAILAFAAIKRADPERWDHWYRILAKYQKAEVVEYMLSEPLPTDAADCQAKAARLVAICLRNGIEFFHDPDQRGWASVQVDGHWENHALRSRAFQLLLLRQYYRESGENPGARVVRAALDLFEARALFDGPECLVHLRVAEYEGRIYLDLCDPAWRAVEIDVDGWRVIERPPAKFRRPRGSQPIPMPERGGSIEELRRFLNVDDDAWVLIKAFLVTTLRSSIPCPILVLKGEQGSGKTTACRVISSLIDPRTSALRGAPREVRDLIAAARNSYVVCFDNLSRLPEELADAACRLATGGGFGGRELYTDHDEATFDAIRPLVFNAIPDLGAARPDFLDRALIVEFNNIEPEQRRDERQFWSDFEKARPRIQGALLHAAVAGLRNLPKVSLERLPRMADFTIWASACAEVLETSSVQFREAYLANRNEGRGVALESSPLYEPLQRLVRDGFTGSTAELLTNLNGIVSDGIRRSDRWPKTPSSLGNALRRMASNLRAVGIELGFSRADHRGRRMVSVNCGSINRKTPSAPSASSAR